MKTEVGAYEARTKLPELLRGVRSGRCYTITHRGRAIADLVPANGTGRHDPADAVEELLRFMTQDPVRGIDMHALLEEGRS